MMEKYYCEYRVDRFERKWIGSFGKDMHINLKFITNFKQNERKAYEMVVNEFNGLYIKDDAYDKNGKFQKNYHSLWMDRNIDKIEIWELTEYAKEIIKNEFIEEMEL